MIFERRIRINERDYYLGIELKYDNKLLVKLDGSYFDMGDFNIMIDCVEKSYEEESKKLIYDKENPAMNNIIYLYDMQHIFFPYTLNPWVLDAIDDSKKLQTKFFLDFDQSTP